MSGPEEESVVVDLWTTGEGRREELIDGLLGLFERFRSSDGFIEARVLQGSGGTVVLSYVRMRSAADQRRLDEDPEVRAGLEALRKFARPHRDSYDVVWVFTPPSDHEPISRSRGAY